MNAETRTLVRAALDPSDYVRGAQQLERANESIATSGEAAARATERQQVVLRESGGAIDRLQRSLDQTYRAQQQFERAQTTINAAMERGLLTSQRAAELTALAQQRYLGAGNAAAALAAANDNAGRASSRLTQFLGQASFQVQDFATQVAMGQSATTAFAVQFAQLAGVLGPAGAIAGGIVTVGLLATRLFGARDAAEELKKAQEALAAAMRVANELFETQAERASRLEREQRASAVQGFQNAFAQQATRVAEERRALTLLEREVQERAQANANVPGFDAEQVFAQRLNERRRAVAVAEQELLDLNRRLEEARTRQSGADREKEEREAEEAARRASQRVQTALQQQEDERRRAGERREREDQAILERSSQRVQNAVQRAEEERRREEERAREQRDREAQRELEQREAANRRVTDDIVRYGAEAFADMFEANGRGWRGMLDSFASTFRRLIARLAAEAIIRPIIAPIVSGLGLGSFGGSVGGASAGGGIGDILGLGSSINNLTGGGIANWLGLGSGGISGVVDGINAWGASTGIFGNGITAAMQGPTLTGAPLGSLAQSGWLSGSTTLLGTLGALGSGFGIGTTLNSLIGGKSEGGMVGSGVGSAAGAIIGSIIPGVGTVLGALLGGSGGGLLGGLIGPDRNRPPFWGVEISADNGLLGTRTSGGKRDNGQLNQLLAQTEQEIASLNQMLRATGIEIAGATMIGSDPADPDRPANLGAAFSRFRFTAANANLNRALSGRSFASSQELGAAADWVLNTYNVLTASTSPAEQFAAQIKAVNDNFAAAIAQARQFGLETEKLAQAQRRATETLRLQRDAQVLSTALGQSRILGDFLAGMGRGTGSPQSQFAEAQAQFAAAVDTARAAGGRAADLTRVTGAAQALLQANSAFNASGTAAAAVEQMVRSTLTSLGGALDLPGFTEDVTATLNRWGEAQFDELQILNQGVAALREEFRTIALLLRRDAAA